MNLQVLLGYRILLQRAEDSEVFSGWVEFADDLDLKITPTYEDFDVTVGQLFNATVTYQYATAHFQAIAAQVRPKEIKLEIQGRITLSPLDEDPRMRRVMTCMMATGEDEVEVEIVDVSNGGLALLSDVPLPRNTQVELTIPLKPIPLSVVGEVRYSNQTEEGRYRAGVFFQAQDRITRGRWRSFIQQTSWDQNTTAA